VLFMLIVVFLPMFVCRSPGGDAVAQAPPTEESVLLLGRDEHCDAGFTCCYE